MKRLTQEEFVDMANSVHNNTYNYDKTVYSKMSDKIIITCKIHGDFKQRATDHIRGGSRNSEIRGCGCPRCGLLSRTKRRSLTQEEFVDMAIKQHGTKFDYSKSNYVNMKTKIKIKCPIHGEYKQIPEKHLKGVGCPKCSYNISIGEKEIQKFLDANEINYEVQKTFSDLYYKNNKAKLRYDFYIPDYNLLLEFHGEQQIRPINIRGIFPLEQDQFKMFHHLKIKDNMKESYAESNGFLFIEIHYSDNIQDRLNQIFYGHGR